MSSNKTTPVILILLGLFLAIFVYPTGLTDIFCKLETRALNALSARPSTCRASALVGNRKLLNVPFRLGLDLLGGTHLVYQADLSNIGGQSRDDAMAGVRDVIERRVNLFGVTEPIVQIEGGDRLVVELAGITDVNQAIDLIGQTPFLEFKEERPGEETRTIIEAQQKGQRLTEDPLVSTGLTGRHLKRSQLVFDPNTGQPQVSLELNDEGTKLFSEITKRNLNKIVAIYIDGVPISTPVVQSEITTGQAVISGQFALKEAKDLANRLNAGALPVPINLASQQTIGATLGKASLEQSLRAGLYGLLAVGVFMLAFYRLPGLMAVLALLIYTAIVLALYKLIPVTLTLAGIAGFILSLGIAVDANVLIFARLREELKVGRPLTQALHEGFRRAWFSIRDSHVTTLLGALVLYVFSTSIVKGFALTLGLGVLTSLFTATVVTKAFLMLVVGPRLEKKRWLF